jgi:hypothetical protein
MRKFTGAATTSPRFAFALVALAIVLPGLAHRTHAHRARS